MKRLAILFTFLSLLSISGHAAKVAIIVHSDHKFDTLTKDQIRRIFLGNLKQFPDGLSVKPVSYSYMVQSREYFYESILGMNAIDFKREWANKIFSGLGYPPKEFESKQDVLKLVSNDIHAIGYIDLDTIGVSENYNDLNLVNDQLSRYVDAGNPQYNFKVIGIW